MPEGAAEMNAAASVAERVARGVALLDEMVPGWNARIDLDYLDVQDYRECVLGQTFDNSTFAVDLLGLDDPAAYGFEPAPGEDDAVWAEIDRAWRTLILSRRPAPPG